MTIIASLLRNAQLPESPTERLDAELLLAAAIGKSRSYLHTWPERIVSSEAADTYTGYLQRRRSGEPVAYILGQQGFWKIDLEVAPHTLIPRPDTELLVETARRLEARVGPGGTAARMGPGYFPLLLGILLTGLGILITVQSFRSKAPDGDPIGKIAWRPLGFIIGANLAFGGRTAGSSASGGRRRVEFQAHPHALSLLEGGEEPRRRTARHRDERRRLVSRGARGWLRPHLQGRPCSNLQSSG